MLVDFYIDYIHKCGSSGVDEAIFLYSAEVEHGSRDLCYVSNTFASEDTLNATIGLNQPEFSIKALHLCSLNNWQQVDDPDANLTK